MAINGIYQGFFQKSKCFLFPAIGVQKNQFSTKLSTYMAWPNRFDLTNYKLFVHQSQNEDTEKYRAFETTFLLKSRLFESLETDSNGKMIYIFDMSSFSDDYDKVVAGQYAALSPRLKEKVKHYFGDGSPEYDYMHSYLYPEKYFERYAAWLNGCTTVHSNLNVTEAMLREIGQLCDPPLLKNETIEKKLVGIGELII